MKITEVTYEEFSNYEFQPPATYFCKSALGTYYFFHGRDRAKCQEACDQMFGKGKYKLIAAKMQKANKECTARG